MVCELLDCGCSISDVIEDLLQGSSYAPGCCNGIESARMLQVPCQITRGMLDVLVW